MECRFGKMMPASKDIKSIIERSGGEVINQPAIPVPGGHMVPVRSTREQKPKETYTSFDNT